MRQHPSVKLLLRLHQSLKYSQSFVNIIRTLIYFSCYGKLSCSSKKMQEVKLNYYKNTLCRLQDNFL